MARPPSEWLNRSQLLARIDSLERIVAAQHEEIRTLRQVVRDAGGNIPRLRARLGKRSLSHVLGRASLNLVSLIAEKRKAVQA